MDCETTTKISVLMYNGINQEKEKNRINICNNND